MPYVVNNKIQFLSEAGQLLAATLDYNVTLLSVSRLIVESIADFCIIDIVENEEIKRVTVRSYEDSDQLLSNKMYSYPPDPRNKEAIYDAARGESILIKKVTEKWLNKVSRIKAERDLVRDLRLKSFIFVPMKSRDRVIGVLTIASNKEGFEYSQDDLVLVEAFAARAALAVDNSRLFSEAQNALQVRDEFLSIASHELKTPLTSILLALQYAIRHLRNSGRTIEKKAILSSLAAGVTQTRRLSALINDLLNVSVISMGKLKIDKEEVDLVQVIKDTIAGFGLLFEKKKIKISFKYKNKAIVGMWDRIRLEEVFSNLISNALKYGKGKAIIVDAQVKNNKAIIKIKDKGMGINEAEQKYIFELFRRTNAAKDLKGMGIGLYVTNQIIMAHNGKITINSIEGKGSTFIIELPLR